MASMTRDTVETRVFGVLRIVTIVLLLIITIFPFYYMGLLSLRPLDRVLQDPGALWVPPSDLDLDSYGSVVAPPSAGGQGFLSFMANSAIVAVGTVALTLLIALPGAYAVSRLQFFGRRSACCSWPSTCSRRSCSRSRSSSSSRGSGCAARSSGC
jgi:multiple sugar transport system permease protein